MDIFSLKLGPDAWYYDPKDPKRLLRLLFTCTQEVGPMEAIAMVFVEYRDGESQLLPLDGLPPLEPWDVWWVLIHDDPFYEACA